MQKNKDGNNGHQGVRISIVNRKPQKMQMGGSSSVNGKKGQWLDASLESVMHDISRRRSSMGNGGVVE
jgi:hypothetical protein